MAKRRSNKQKEERRNEFSKARARQRPRLEAEYKRACELVSNGEFDKASHLYETLQRKACDHRQRALVLNDMAALSAIAGDMRLAKQGFRAALAIDPACEPAHANLVALDRQALKLVRESESASRVTATNSTSNSGFAAATSVVSSYRSFMPRLAEPPNGIRVAILSLLFNWPSTGGGIIHTVELAAFLARAGFDVRHFYAKYPHWGAGKVEMPPPFPSEPLEFDASTWNIATIQDRFRRAVDEFKPNHVIITDSWNFKPLLAEAVGGYPYVLRFQAMECICPLNNVRLLPEGNGRFGQCRRNQLAEPETCAQCVHQRGHMSGILHQAERELSGVGTPEYQARLIRAFRDAEAVLVVNPLMEALVAPYSTSVRTVTAGMDPARFPWPWPHAATASNDGETPGELRENGRLRRLLFAGIVEELLKGFAVLHEACRLLWQKRKDFELVATGDPQGRFDEFTRFVGWLSQEDLPRHLREADILAMPTIAQEALGRTAVEAMAAGRPVVASRLGGLPFTVIDGVTGLLCEPGDPVDLARKIERLLDDDELRERMGLAGRLRFAKDYSWNAIIERHYRPLLASKPRRGYASDEPLFEKSQESSSVERISGIRLSLIVSVLESYEVVRRQLLHLNHILTPECELILVDDGSTPSLEQVCASVPKDYAFRLIFTNDERPWTQPKARNLAASVAKADKLLFFDIDHILTESIVQTCLGYAGDKLHWVRRPGVLDDNGNTVTSEETLKDYGLADSVPSVHVNSFMIRKELFDLLGGYDEKFCGTYGGDDVDFNNRYARLCQLSLARPDETMGEGYVYLEPASDQKGLFHSLTRA